MPETINTTLTPGDSLTITDARGNEIIVISFDNDPGAFLLQIAVYDTDGRSLSTLGLDYLGAGYPQDRYFVNQVIRSTLPKRSPERPFPVIGEPKEAPGQRAELNPDDPTQETWCEIVGDFEAGGDE